MSSLRREADDDAMSISLLRFSVRLMLLTFLSILVLFLFFVNSRPFHKTVHRNTLSRHHSRSNPPDKVQKGGGSPQSRTSEDGVCERQFIAAYKRYCEQFLQPHKSNISPKYSYLSSTELVRYLCPCVPQHLRTYNCELLE